MTDQAKPPTVAPPEDTGKSLAVARRLARSAQLPDTPRAVLAGPLEGVRQRATASTGEEKPQAQQRCRARYIDQYLQNYSWN